MHTYLRGYCKKACKEPEHESNNSTSQLYRGWFWLDLYQCKSESHYIYIIIHLPDERPGAFCRLRLLSSHCNLQRNVHWALLTHCSFWSIPAGNKRRQCGWEGWNWAGWLSGEDCLKYVVTSLLMKTLTIFSPSSEPLHGCTDLRTVFQPKSKSAWRFGQAN